MNPDRKDVEALIQEKYDGNRMAPGVTEDIQRLTQGEPLAYVIGTIPFLGLTIDLTSRSLIPRPETEWWTEELIKYIGARSLRVLDLCAGSGAIGLSILKHTGHTTVSFGELRPEHTEQIEKNLALNGLSRERATIRTSDLFDASPEERFDIIATNPPYIPSDRVLDESVTRYEPTEALVSGPDGLELIRRILKETPDHLNPHGELWMECDISNIEAAATLAQEHGAQTTEIRTDPYGRPRILVAYY